MESHKGVWVFILIVSIVAIGWFYFHNEAIAPAHVVSGKDEQLLPQTLRDVALDFDGKVMRLENGVATIPAAPGSASMVTTTYFGNEATGDLNGDGTDDTAFLVTQTSGGSGTFYYVVVALKTAAGYLTTNPILLGDRVAPQTTEIHQSANGPVVVVNYADRNKGEPMTASPSRGVSRTFHVVHGGLEEIKQ